MERDDMAQGTCKIDGCDGAHLARGWCSKHYRRWRKHGDPLTLVAARYEGVICSIDGCHRDAEKRGWCGLHYRRWWLHGGAAWLPRVPQYARPVKVHAERKPLSEMEIAWLAGLFEGEGTIVIRHRKFVRLVIGMTDRDVIERVDALVPMPNGPRRKTGEKAHYKDQFIWYAQRAPIVESLLNAMLPWLGDRRRARAIEALEVLVKHHPGSPGHQRRAKTHCPQDHPYDDKNTYTNARGQRSCRICNRQRARRYEARSRAKRAVT
jgi:hypothetical protein